jgi:hypothetical protein
LLWRFFAATGADSCRQPPAHAESRQGHRIVPMFTNARVTDIP